MSAVCIEYIAVGVKSVRQWKHCLYFYNIGQHQRGSKVALCSPAATGSAELLDLNSGESCLHMALWVWANPEVLTLKWHMVNQDSEM